MERRPFCCPYHGTAVRRPSYCTSCVYKPSSLITVAPRSACRQCRAEASAWLIQMLMTWRSSESALESSNDSAGSEIEDVMQTGAA